MKLAMVIVLARPLPVVCATIDKKNRASNVNNLYLPLTVWQDLYTEEYYCRGKGENTTQ